MTVHDLALILIGCGIGGTAGAIAGGHITEQKWTARLERWNAKLAGHR